MKKYLLLLTLAIMSCESFYTQQQPLSPYTGIYISSIISDISPGFYHEENIWNLYNPDQIKVGTRLEVINWIIEKYPISKFAGEVDSKTLIQMVDDYDFAISINTHHNKKWVVGIKKN
jgi:hypothetical protein